MQRNKFHSKGKVTRLIYRLTDEQIRSEIWCGYAYACVKNNIDVKTAAINFLEWMPPSKPGQSDLLKIHNSNKTNRIWYGYCFALRFLFDISVDKAAINFIDWIDPTGITDYSVFRRSYFLLAKYYKQYRPTLNVNYKPTNDDVKKLITEFLIFNSLCA